MVAPARRIGAESRWREGIFLGTLRRLVKGLPWDPHATRPDDQGQRAENTVAGRIFFANRASSRRRWRDVKVVLLSPQRIIDESLTTANARNEWKVQCVTTQLEQNPRDGKVKWRQDRTWSWARAAATVEQLRGAAKCTHLEEHEERPKMQGCRVCKTLQRYDLSIAHMMRLGEQTCGNLQLVRHAP